MSPLSLLEKYYPTDRPAHPILLDHSLRVAEKAVAIARRLGPGLADPEFVREAALLHDIGIGHTAAPDIGCHGELPYLAHGLKGRELLEAEGLPRHALVCERHIGVGLSAAEIRERGLPLPGRDMLPLSVEEQIITYADLFFSKKPSAAERERAPQEVRIALGRFGAEKIAIFDAWHARFAE